MQKCIQIHMACNCEVKGTPHRKRINMFPTQWLDKQTTPRSDFRMSHHDEWWPHAHYKFVTLQGHSADKHTQTHTADWQPHTGEYALKCQSTKTNHRVGERETTAQRERANDKVSPIES